MLSSSLKGVPPDQLQNILFSILWWPGQEVTKLRLYASRCMRDFRHWSPLSGTYGGREVVRSYLALPIHDSEQGCEIGIP